MNITVVIFAAVIRLYNDYCVQPIVSVPHMDRFRSDKGEESGLQNVFIQKD